MDLVLYDSNFHDVEKNWLLFGVKLRFTSEPKLKDALKHIQAMKSFHVILLFV